MPSVWIEPRRNKHGVNHIVRWEISSDGITLRGSESCGPSKRYASRRASEILKDLYEGRRPRPQAKPITVPAFAQEYLQNSAKTKAKNTHSNFDAPALRHFQKWAGNKLLGFLEEDPLAALSRWRDSLIKDGYGPNTVRMRLRALSAALGWAVEHRYLTSNPFQAVRRKSNLFPPAKDAARYLTEPEIAKLIPALPRRVAQALYFLLHTGLRHGELLALDWKHIHRGKTWIAGVHSPKTGASREIALAANVQDVMGRPKAEGKVFEGMTRTWIGKALRVAASGLDMGAVRVHDFRHTWATNFMYETGNQFELLYRGGWASLASAAIYQHIRKREPVEYKPFPHYFPTKRQRPVKLKVA